MPDLLLTSNGRTETEEDYDVTSEGRLVGHIFKMRKPALELSDIVRRTYTVITSPS
jgi:hypothetical protein